jgi:hypothetical protein
MTKASVEAKPAGRPVPPRTINLVIAAVCVQVVFLLIRAGSMFGYTDELRRLLVDSNKKAKKPVNPYGPSQIADDLHHLRTNGLVQGVVVSVALLLLAFSLRRPSTAGITRWGLLVVMVLTGGPLTIIPAHGLPIVPQVSLVLAGLASIVAIVALFLPDSRNYFKAIGAARLAASGRTATPGRGLAGLFTPRPAAERKPPPASGLRSTAASRANARVAAKGGAAGTRAKVRSDEAAVARGAALARSRAKASKSRRTEQ